MFVNLASQWFDGCAGVAVHVFVLCFGHKCWLCFLSVFSSFPCLSGFCDASWNPFPCLCSEQASHSE